MPEERKIPKVRKCRICKKRYKPLTLYQWWCCDEHQDELINHLATAARKKRIQQQDKFRKKEAQQETRHLKIRKLALQPLRHFHKQAQAAFNEFIRTRDAAAPCISCGRFHDGKYDAGHYRTRGASPATRYDETNCHKQCVPCNQHLSGNIENYTPNLIKKIGQDAFDRLMGPHPISKWTREELQELAAHYRQKTRELIAQRSEAA
ncbi:MULTISPECIES: recombination protein NinG [Pantoea]|uniref:Protein ninG n=2 Tax=Pantoea TaxID=53335 RepID=A0A0U3T3U9_9GAMM|nr:MULTISPECIES: recombination protein NinG [Pantoea]ALV92436.1 protein ninG [Pantoea vagans]KHJ67978.1 protein ninG [Pantoea rodasii]